MSTPTANKLVREFKTVARDAEDLIEATAGAVSDKAKEARSRLTAALESAKETCQDWQEKAVAGAKATDKAIREHPYPSIGLAFGLGLLIGLLAGRRNSD
jgi:ElaB/YqjD/DUF883 family membrane-anchored ribosome-binding protein